MVHQWLTSTGNVMHFYADGFALIGNSFVNWHKQQKLSIARRTPHSALAPSDAPSAGDGSAAMKPVALDGRHLGLFSYIIGTAYKSSAALNVTTGEIRPIEPQLRASHTHTLTTQHTSLTHRHAPRLTGLTPPAAQYFMGYVRMDDQHVLRLERKEYLPVTVAHVASLADVAVVNWKSGETAALEAPPAVRDAPRTHARTHARLTH